MKFSDDILMAYADGELDAATRAAIEEAIAGDPELARAVERHRALAARIRSGYEHVVKEPVPERLASLVAAMPAAPAVDAAAERTRRAGVPARWRTPRWMALAASVAVALFVGILVLRGPGAPYEEIDGRRVARGTLEQALTAQLASRPDGSGVGIGISFRDRAGDYCRTFLLQRQEPLAGLACRSDAGWELRVLADAPAPDGEVRAAGAMPLAVLQAVDAAIAGEPLDAAAEAAARDAGWRNERNMAE